MKSFVQLIMLLAMLFSFEKVLPQDLMDIHISGDFTAQPLREVLNRIEEQYEISFSYVEQYLEGITVTIRIKNQKLAEALRRILKGTGLSFKIYPDSRDVVIFKAQGPLSQSPAQYTISGFVRDTETGENLVGANVYDPQRSVGTTTNPYAFFSLTLPTDSVTLAISYIGYQNYYRRLFLKRDMEMEIRLTPGKVEGDTVQVLGNIDVIERETQMSAIDLPLRNIKTLPVLGGEADVMKTMQLLPGVQSGTEGTSGIYVRGGSPDQNLILLDGAPVYNVSHAFGLLSVFNTDAINNVNITKGGFPGRYGGRLSSVVEMNMKEGNNQELHGNLTLGLVSSKMMLEAPIIKNKSSFIISARRTYIDVLARPFLNNDGFYFYDFNSKVNYSFSPRNRIFFSIYLGRDKFYAEEKNSFDRKLNFKTDLGWGNVTSTIRWNHVLNQKLFSNTTLTYSKYRFDTASEETVRDLRNQVTDLFESTFFSGIRDWSARIDFDYIPTPDHYIKFGGGVTYHTFSPGAFQVKREGQGVRPVDQSINPSGEINAVEMALYAEDDLTLASRLKANLGVHSSLFLVNDEVYTSLQPRLSFRYLLTEELALKSSFATMKQYIHLLTNSGIGLPTDLWVPATARINPQESWQAAFGIARSIANNTMELSIEGYYKKMDHLIEYKDGALFLGLDTDWQHKVEMGEGRSYGTELFLQKKRGRLTGWLGYTLSWTDRKFSKINFGRRFPARYDRRHDLALATTYDLTRSMEFSGAWVYGTGNAISMPSARYLQNNTLRYLSDSFLGALPNGIIDYFGERNGFRIKSYHRLDLSIRFHKRKGDKEHIFALTLYNAYSRKNPFFLFLDSDGQEKRLVKQFTLFPIVPSISYSFSF